MERDPHMLIEGMLIAAYALGAKTNYIYTRGEYRYLIDIMDVALAEARAAACLAKTFSAQISPLRFIRTLAPARTSAVRRRRCSVRSKVCAGIRA